MLRRIADAHSTAKVVPSLDVQSLLHSAQGAIRSAAQQREISMDSVASITYVLGWISLAVAVVYRVLLLGSVGQALFAISRGLVPRSFLGFSALLFLVCIASDLRARASRE